MKASLRHNARKLALQGLYGRLMSGNDPKQIALDLSADNDMTKLDVNYFQTLLHGVCSDAEKIETTIKPYLGRLPEELDPIEKCILQIATFELVNRFDIPFKVVINEAIELAKAFGAEESHKFVNGALDKAVKTLRKDER